MAAAVAVSLSVGVVLLDVGLGLASKLDRDLALKDLLARELSDGALCLGGSGQVDKSVANGALGAWVLGNGDSLAADDSVSANFVFVNFKTGPHLGHDDVCRVMRP